MAIVRVEQRNAHLAGPVRLEMVNGRDGKVAKATLIAISNVRRGTAEEREEEATAIRWTLWGRQAENAAGYLGKGSHVNVVGRLSNNDYRDGQGTEVHAFDFTCEEIDYLDSRAEGEARRVRQEGGQAEQGGPAEALPPSAAPARQRKPRAPVADGTTAGG